MLVYFCCFSCRLWSHRFRTWFLTQGWIFVLSPKDLFAVESSTSFRLFARVSTYLLRMQRAKKKLSADLSLEHFRCFRVFEFLQVKSDARALRRALGFQLQLDGCKYEVMIAASVGTWKRPYV